MAQPQTGRNVFFFERRVMASEMEAGGAIIAAKKIASLVARVAGVVVLAAGPFERVRRLLFVLLVRRGD